MSDATSVRIAYAKESTYKVNPGGAFTIGRITGESLGQDTQTVPSSEMRSDGQVTAVKRVGVSASGAFNVELIPNQHDSLILAAIRAAAFPVLPTAITGVDASTVDDSFNGTFTGISAGDWIITYGFTNKVNNGIHRVVSATGSKIVVDTNLVTEVTGAGKTVRKSAVVDNGSTLSSFFIEKKYTDLVNTYAHIPGAVISGATFTWAMQQYATGAFNFTAAGELSAAADAGTSYVLGEAVLQPAATIDEVSGPWAIIEAAGLTRQLARQVSLSISLNPRPRMNLGELQASDVKLGQIAVTGTLQQYFASHALMDKYLNYESSRLAIGFFDITGKGLLFELPRIKFTSGRRVAGGVNTDVIADMQFSAEMDATTTSTIRVHKF